MLHIQRSRPATSSTPLCVCFATFAGANSSAEAVRSPALFTTEQPSDISDVIVGCRGPCTSQVGTHLKLCLALRSRTRIDTQVPESTAFPSAVMSASPSGRSRSREPARYSPGRGSYSRSASRGRSYTPDRGDDQVKHPAHQCLLLRSTHDRRDFDHCLAVLPSRRYPGVLTKLRHQASGLAGSRWAHRRPIYQSMLPRSHAHQLQ